MGSGFSGAVCDTTRDPYLEDFRRFRAIFARKSWNFFSQGRERLSEFEHSFKGNIKSRQATMPDGLVFYLAILFSKQLALLLAPVEGDAFAQPQDGQRRRDVARHDAMHDFRR